MKTNIGIDARLFSQTGVGVYIQNLLHFLPQYIEPDQEYYVYLLPEDYDMYEVSNPHIHKRKAPYKWHSLGEQVGFAYQLYKDALDLMHFTYFSHPILYRRPFIATVHDVILLDFMTGKASTKHSVLYFIKRIAFMIAWHNLIRSAKKIITPTQTVKKQIIEKYGIGIAPKITPIYEGVDWRFGSTKQNKTLEAHYDFPYFLYVGNFYPHKNVERLLEAFSNLPNKKVKLVLKGPSDFFSKRLVKQISSLKITDRVVFHTKHSLEDLVFLYDHALAIVQPSFSEGFGLPLIEAAYMNRPIVASHIEVFKELFGQSYRSFNPYHVNDICKSLSDELDHPQKPSYDLSPYSFETMTRETVSIYTKLSTSHET